VLAAAGYGRPEAHHDVHGHLVGSRALCRLADVLRLHSRGMDTPARYGGDEFALIVPEAGAAEARQIAERIVARVAQDGEAPPVSVSVGAAIFPADGGKRREAAARRGPGAVPAQAWQADGAPAPPRPLQLPRRKTADVPHRGVACLLDTANSSPVWSCGEP